MSDLEKSFGIIVSPINYKVSGMESTRSNRKIIVLNSLVKEAAYLETEIFKSFFGEDLGKKEFFLEAGSYGNIIEAYENTLKTLLEKEHKIPEEHNQNRMQYLKEFVSKQRTNEELTHSEQWNARHSDIYEALGNHYIMFMRYVNGMVPYNFNNYYLKMKSFYDNGDSLYISTALNYKELGF